MSVATGLIILFSVLLAYSQYVTLKKAFVSRLSDKASSFAGQKVRIGDLSFGPSAGINIHDIAVQNPEGFKDGHLLKVKRVTLQVNYLELFRGRISLRSIEVAAPELTLISDDKDRLNISDTLRTMSSGKGTTKYQVDALKIRSGVFDLNKDQRYHIGDMHLTLRDLSSEPGTKTLIEAGASSPGRGKISAKGWAFLKADPKKINLSFSWEEVRLSLFKQLMGKGTADDDISGKADINVHTEGDTRDGIAFKLGIHLREFRSRFIKKDVISVMLNADAVLNPQEDSFTINNAVLKADGISTSQLTGLIRDISRSPSYKMRLKIGIPDLSVFNPPEGLTLGGALTSDGITINGKSVRTWPVFAGELQLRNASVGYGGIHTETADARITFDGTAESVAFMRGSASARVKKLSVSRVEGKKTLVKNADLGADISFRGKDLSVKVDARAGATAATVTGTVDGFMGEGRSARFRAVLPETGLADIRSAFWDVFPDKMLYAGINGSVKADVSLGYGEGALSAEGELQINSVTLEGENGEYSIGPVNGSIPLFYTTTDKGEAPPSLPSFEQKEFQELRGYYARKQQDEGSRKITLGSFRYGFRLLDNIELWTSRQGSYLNIGRFGANIFGGRLDGSAVVDMSDGISYRAGFLVKGISLTQLCDEITPIKGYITGKVDGLALLKGSGSGLDGIIGRMDFWSYTEGGEKTKISKDFLQKVGGPQMKAYVGERPFDKGTISAYLQNGFLIFRELEISHKNVVGMSDLMVKVAPFNNRIELDHLMSTITVAAERAKEK
ncbi:MAG TPA: AsmA family protein [Thermodesulfovibrionales bacterium]|nr:AsmA family protein [Thermodesulfovibrionales bacterium]